MTTLRFFTLAIGLVLMSAGTASRAQPAVAPVSQIELNGTRIGEARTTIERRLGKPQLTGTLPDGLEYWVYGIDDAAETQLIVTFENFRRDYAFGVQLTGGRSAKASSFLGINLGDSRGALDAALGLPTADEPVEDPAVAGRGLRMLSYANRNYTVEVDKDSRVYSIRINGYEGWLERFGWKKSWDEYRPWSLAAGLVGVDAFAEGERKKGWYSMDGRLLKIRPRVVFLGEPRALTDGERDLIVMGLKMRNVDPTLAELYRTTVSVSEAGVTYRVAIQETLLGDLLEEVPLGSPVDLFAIVIGRSHKVPDGLFAVNEFQQY